MRYYEVWVASHRYHGSDPLTYSSEVDLPVGSIVQLQLRNEKTEGIIVRLTTKPSFAAKPLGKLLIDQPLPAVSLELLTWLSAYYPGPSGVITNLFLPGSLLTKQSNDAKTRKPSVQKAVLPTLTPEQKQVVKEFSESDQQTFLLHGETASGKTRVYMELAQKILDQGKSVIVLTPEIGLTSPLARTFSDAGFSTVVIHSNLTPKQRREAWLQILCASEPLVIIGPRSALFAPLTSLGLIVIDEAHDGAYKQDQTPYYQASRVAGKLAALHKAKLVLGTATPTVNDYYLAKAKQLPVLRMSERASSVSTAEAKVTVINAREKERFGRDPYLSDELLASIEQALQTNEQSLVFLNRRGTARLIMCQSCGWQAMCPNCDLPLTYHGDKHIARCHTCGFTENARTSCPVCKSADIVFKSIGTKALESSLKRLFPDARVRRFDTDNLKEDRFEEQYQAVADGEVDILVGTQMLIKGHDLPKLSVVGVVAADTSLYFPDFTAEEQTYQLLRQVKGRVGRGHRPGHAIVQTYNPDSSAIQAALQGKWDEFFEAQLKERRTFGFPPFVQLLKLSCARATQASAQAGADRLMADIRKLSLPVQLIGPAPRLLEKVGGKYQWQVIVKSKQRAPLLTIIKNLPANWSYDLDPNNLL